MDYNQTVHLPKTDFPMRASLPAREPAMLESMYSRDLYRKMVARNEGKPTFILHDGPPYANGNIHIGTAMNKILKDMIVKYKNMSGFQSPYVPGWDTHGLPIESAVLKDKKVKREEMTTAEFRDKCREYAMGYIEKMTSQFQRLGVLGEWDDPYITLNPDFEAKQVEVFGQMAANGLIYKGMKPIYWCPSDQTALAEAEIEYADDPCTTVFVKFPVLDDKGKLGSYCDLKKLSFVIWTTTPWTLPGNMAICVNPEFDYVLLEISSGEVFIVAKDLAEKVCKAAGIDFSACKTLATLKGADFELMTASHPLFDRESVLLCGEHVTLEAGSGCVHTAPGFGADDFAICQKYDKAGLTHIGVPVPVNAKGVMTDERYAGNFYAKGNPLVIADLEQCGALLAKADITHSYPHCWRCKNPVIFRATEQWFCSVDAIKAAAVASCDQIWWKPDWGKDRMTSMISERNDWCISRQRVWGVPIPIFYCDDCGADIVTPATIARVAELFRAHGSNVWFEREAKDLLPDGFVCPKCGKTHFSKESDIMDVWFDSGSTHAAVLDNRNYLSSPADLYLEGGDQYRGWFQSSMLTSIATKGAAPYKQIVTHGWTVDGEGKAMHKSLGNAVAPDEVIKDYGADLLRLWVSSTDYTQDMRISKDIMKQLSDAYLKIRNTARYMLGSLCGFDPDTDLVTFDAMLELDQWAVARLGQVVDVCLKSYQVYEFHAVYRAIYNFCVVDLSNFYFDVIKDRLYCGDAAQRRSAQSALYRILDGMTRLIAPILAFTGDEIWAAMPHAKDVNAESPLLNDMPAHDAYTLSPAQWEQWNAVLALRTDVNKALEQARAEKKIGKSLEASVTLYFDGDEAQTFWKTKLGAFDAEALADLCIVSHVDAVLGGGDGVKGEGVPGLTVAVSPLEAPKCSRCWKRDEQVNDQELCPRCAHVLTLEH